MGEQWIVGVEDHGAFRTVIRLYERGEQGHRLLFRLDPKAAPERAPVPMLALHRRGEARPGPSVSRLASPVPPEAPTTWLLDEDLAPDVVEAHVRWEWKRADGTPLEHERVVSLVNRKAYNPPAPVKKDLGQLAAPRRVVGLNTTPVPAVSAPADVSFDLPAMDAKTLQRPPLGPAHLKGLQLILDTVAARLDEGFDGLWAAIDPRFPELGQVAREAKERGTVTLSRLHLDELWARRVSEMLTLIPYTGPGLQYFDSQSAKRELPLLTRVLDDDDPCYPLVCACQHLSTLGFTTRGVPWTAKDSLNAGSQTMVTVRAVGGTYHLEPDAPYGGAPRPLANLGASCPEFQGAGAAAAALRVPGFGPGAVFVWANRRAHGVDEEKREDADGHPVIEGADGAWFRQDNRSAAHIAFVLRAGFPRGTVQFFDTGGAGIKGREDGVASFHPPGPFGGNYDDPPSASVPGSGDPCRGIGVPPPVSVETLAKAVDRLARARPLGLARLVLIDRSVKPIQGGLPAAAFLYVSPWLRMYRHGAPEKVYSIARFAWSLRGLPGRDRIEARWLFETPYGAAAEAFMAADPQRVRTLSGLAATPKVLNAKGKMRARRIMELHNVPDSDQVRVAFRRHEKASKFVGRRLIVHHSVDGAHAPEGLTAPAYFTQEGAPLRTTSE